MLTHQEVIMIFNQLRSIRNFSKKVTIRISASWIATNILDVPFLV